MAAAAAAGRHRCALLLHLLSPASAPRRFLAKHNAIFFPKDVTLNYKKASSEYLRLWESAVGGGAGAAAGASSGAARAKQPWAITDPRKLLDLE